MEIGGSLIANGVELKIELDGVHKKLSDSNLSKGRHAMANQILLDMDRYVPKKRGDLRASGRVVDDARGVKYSQPYARAQFYGKSFRKGKSYTFRNYSTPGTGPRWDLKAQGAHGKNWAKVYAKGAGL